MSDKLATRAFLFAESAALAATVAYACLAAGAQEWRPVSLVVLLAVLSLAGQYLQFTIRGQRLSAGYVPLALAMTLTGPSVAVALALMTAIMASARRNLSPSLWLGNLASFAVAMMAGGVLSRALAGNVHDPHNQLPQTATFALIVFLVFMVSNAINFAVIALGNRMLGNRPLIPQLTDLFVPLLPGEAAAAALTSLLAIGYTTLGLPALGASVLVIGIFQYLIVALLRSEERADQLEARSIHLASLQLGVLTTLVETLALRDRSTARHSAAVARYARELARAAGCDEDEQELAHTAGLLHDIGKFALPDRILSADILSDADWDIIRRHPQEGATLVGRLDGYGAVAEAILYHHEQVDGGGYPAGLIGNEIPLASRIIAICSTFDTLIARDTYRTPMTPQDAVRELRRVAGARLDSELVETFAAIVANEGDLGSAFAKEASFEEELAFGARSTRLAQPAG